MSYSKLRPVPASLYLSATRCCQRRQACAFVASIDSISTRNYHYSSIVIDRNEPILPQTHPPSRASDDGRVRLSNLWSPSGGIVASGEEDSHAKLIRAGFVRQAHSGVFHMLPLGKRVQDKLEALIDKHMSNLGASKVDLSSISSEALWTESGRLSAVGAELFRFQDRKASRYLLSPTHEEEITTLVSNATSSYRDLPTRLYQITRKYRDELRPRHGLLRSREFIMKDLYTFDCSIPEALLTYNEVRAAYARLFNELKIPYLVAEADSGNMGGNLSHEFHFPTLKGEDHVISCSDCDYVANEELAEGPVLPPKLEVPESSETTSNERQNPDERQSWIGISKDRSTLFEVQYLKSEHERHVNVHAIKAAFPEIDFAIEDPITLWKESIDYTTSNVEKGSGMETSTGMQAPALQAQIKVIVDGSVPHNLRRENWSKHALTENPLPMKVQRQLITQHPETGNPFSLLRVIDGDQCPRCSTGHLKINKAIELGHTFHLGSRYTKQLARPIMIPKEVIGNREADFEFSTAPGGSQSSQVVMQMGCHGIGLSRMIGAVADTLADEKGLNWPRVMAPYEVVIIANKGLEDGAAEVYDALVRRSNPVSRLLPDLAIDDRSKSFPWKMKDADLVGYPVIIVVGREWKDKRRCELQCRRLKYTASLDLQELAAGIEALLVKL